MRAVLIYCAITGLLLAVALFLRDLSKPSQAMALCTLLALAAGGLLVKICRGSR